VRSIRYWSILHAEGYPGSDHGIPGETPTPYRRRHVSPTTAAKTQVTAPVLKSICAASRRCCTSFCDSAGHLFFNRVLASESEYFYTSNAFRLRQLTVGLVFSTSSPCSRRTHMHAITHYCGSRTHSLCKVSTADGSRTHCKRISQYSLPRPRCSSREMETE
jgi:hypothetical protein